MARLGDMIADYVPEGLHRFELQTLQFFNPSVGDDLSALPARQWPMTRLEVRPAGRAEARVVEDHPVRRRAAHGAADRANLV